MIAEIRPIVESAPLFQIDFIEVNSGGRYIIAVFLQNRASTKNMNPLEYGPKGNPGQDT